jgi:hypothetical protein
MGQIKRLVGALIFVFFTKKKKEKRKTTEHLEPQNRRINTILMI